MGCTVVGGAVEKSLVGAAVILSTVVRATVIGSAVVGIGVVGAAVVSGTELVLFCVVQISVGMAVES